jgi:hypothetical protein
MSVFRCTFFACLAGALLVAAGCSNDTSDSVKKADAENPALRNTMPPDGKLMPQVQGMGGGPGGQGGPGMGKALPPGSQQMGQGGPGQPAHP